MKNAKIVLLSFLILSMNIFAQDDEFFTAGGTVGGYGELHYNSNKVGDADASKTLDFHRFVMFYSYQFSEKWSFKAELELEHNFVSEGEGELELEQAFVDYHYSDAIGFRAGVVLVSAGLINEYHEPPTFLGVERPEYSKYVIPTTWFGNGAQFYGTHKGFEYLFGVMEGLNSDKFSAKNGIRSGRQKGYKANAENLLYNARVDYTGVSGLRIGGSYTYNNATGETDNNAIKLFEVHAKYEAKNLILVGEYGNVSYDKGDVETTSGYYLDLGYNVAELLKVDWDVIPFIRYSDYNTAASTIAGGDSEKAYHKSKFMFGLSVRPVDKVVFKLDYGVSNVELTDVDTKLFNIGVGYMF